VTEAVVHPDGRVTLGRQTFRAALGRSGVRVDKREGDGGTPAGLLVLRRVLYRADRGPIPRTVVPREPLCETDGWCDDVSHPDYNRLVRLPHPARCEELWRRDPLYDIVGVLGWNDAPVERGRGSAIFLHVARNGFAPTEGCVALGAADLRIMLAQGVTALRVLAD
jgi:L,D-peptidoglycan transpeptidase YkuD (ErfK/YbiS/YcfS/YnhG family)